MKKEEKKSVPIEFSVWKELQQEKLDSGLDLYELIREMWNTHKARGNVTARAQASPRAIPIDNRWHRMLQEILASGDHEAITAVQNNLTVFSRVLRATKKGKRAEGSGD